MEIYNATTNLKSGPLRVKKSIGAILITSDQAFSALANEKITAHVERANGKNEEIATNIPLNAFIASSVFGESQIIDNGTSFTALCELANNGAILMNENETLVLSFTDLKSARTYTVNGIEMPVKSNSLITFTEKVMLSGEKQRKFEVQNYDEAYIIGDFEKVFLTYNTIHGSETVEMSKAELRAVNANIGLTRTASSSQITDTCISLVGVTHIELFSTNQLNVILRDVN